MRTTTAVESLLSLRNGVEDWRPPSPPSSLGEASPSFSKSSREDGSESDRGSEVCEMAQAKVRVALFTTDPIAVAPLLRHLTFVDEITLLFFRRPGTRRCCEPSRLFNIVWSHRDACNKKWPSVANRAHDGTYRSQSRANIRTCAAEFSADSPHI